MMIATALESNGATVYIVGRRKEALEKAAKEQAATTAPEGTGDAEVQRKGDATKGDKQIG